MKFVIQLTVMASLTLASSMAFAKAPVKVIPKVIYGEDNRMDVYESSDNLMKNLARGTAVQILNNSFEEVDGITTVKAPTFQAEFNMCKGERFSQQIVAGNCSGFLVAPDLLVTAGHCINSNTDCSQHIWAFDYANTTEEKSSFSFNKDQVYRCTSIVERQKDFSTKADYAVLKLDRPVVGRAPLKFRTDGKASDDSVMTVLGYPSGLPLKITAAADMRNNTNPIFFVTNADTYGGNSGSAVVDSRTGIVEGILVRGDADYAPSTTGERCMTSNYNSQDGGRGEDVTRITIIKALQR